MAKIYALLVGINHYAAPVPALEGCVPDVNAMYDFLDRRTDAVVKCLRNQEAHRDAVIDQFRTHLAKAEKEDIVLFYFCGHGVQEPTNELFYPIEPARMNEALVCYNRAEDTGEGKTFIIADKELAVLLGEVAHKGCQHIVCIFDSCHSGSATRGDRKGLRWLPPFKEARKLEHYYGGAQLQQQVEHNPTAPRRTLSGWTALTHSRHILLAACRSDQFAHEKDFPGMETPRGTFSYHLLQLLQGTDAGRLSYRELFQALKARTLVTVNAQSPQLETPPGADDLQDLEFLGKAVRPRPDHYLVRCQNGIGRVDVGAVHGIQPPSKHDPHEKTVLALFDKDTPTDALRAPGAHDKALGTATLTRVFADESEVLPILKGSLLPPDGSIYKATIIAQPMPRLTVQLDEGTDGVDAPAMELVRAGLNTIEGSGRASRPVRELSTAERAQTSTPTLIVYVETTTAGQQRYRIRRVLDQNPVVVVTTFGINPATARMVVEDLEHIARYMTTLELSNQDPSPLLEGKVTRALTIDGVAQTVAVDKVELLVTRWDVEAGREPVPTMLDPKQGIYALAQQRPPAGQPMVAPYQYHTYALKNNHPTATVYCVVVSLDEKYEVFSHILATPKRLRLGPGESATILDRHNDPRRIFFDLDDTLHDAGVDTVHNSLKLIVSTTAINANDLEQQGLTVDYTTRGGRGLPEMPNNTLARLFRNVSTRGSFDPDAALEFAEWTTRDFTVTIFRPLRQVPIPTAGPARSITAGVAVLPHADLEGVNIAVTAEETATRDLGSYAVPAMLKLRVSEPFTFGAGGKNATAATTVFRLTGETLLAAGADGIPQYGKVTPDNPLQLTADVPLAPEERLVAYGWDGHYFIPVGYAVPRDGTTAIRLNALTPPTSDGQRSVGGSIKIFVQKVTNHVLKRAVDTHTLAMLTLDNTGNATRDASDGMLVRASSPPALEQAVQHASRILLLIHGWTGDTDSITPCLGKLRQDVVPAYDLVLTFDYENLNTPVPETARILFEKLAAIGIGAEQQIDIVAHSMGCFVSRWLIEKVPHGAVMVNRLVMLGAPNDGTSLARIRDVANLTLFLGMNRLATHSILTTLALPPDITNVVPPVLIEGISAYLIDKVQKITDELDMTRTLRALKPGSELLKELRDDPLVHGHSIPYRIIAGDTDLVTERKLEWTQRLKQFAFHASTNLVFLDEPNDTTITVASQRKVPEGRALNIKREQTKSDHISYFYTEDTLNKLVTALTD